MTQIDRIKKHFESGKSLTPMQALNKFGCFRLASVVYKLNKRGMNIVNEPKQGTNYATYVPKKPVKPEHVLPAKYEKKLRELGAFEEWKKERTRYLIRKGKHTKTNNHTFNSFITSSFIWKYTKLGKKGIIYWSDISNS